ncbi:Cell morphogenesis protein PAG1 [Lasiodiplodia theobromae]|uniref:Cell morphogenesis protein PAG1 n=1 Tax=Lasiodiplodia theobromae TaxID=45133 RepID=UPI0015C365BE|nr:Cell morphogenesis protein PAG1 [Lasiodiplodia theobromae]KAF4545998.1 Cell morphogenesis protein PAG1 [Lasiodiplodia theobromae]
MSGLPPHNDNNIDPSLLDEPNVPMSDSEDATNARRNELFEEPQDHANVPAPDNANILAPDNVPNPSSSENDVHDSNQDLDDVPSSPGELSEEEWENYIYRGPNGRGWAREKAPLRPRRKKPSSKKAAGGTAGQGDTGGPSSSHQSHGLSGQAPAASGDIAAQAVDPPAAASEHHHHPNPQTGGNNDVQQHLDPATQEELPADPPPSSGLPFRTRSHQQQEPDDGTDEDAEHDEFDDLFEEEETSTAADASTVAGTPANDFQTPGTEYSDADSNFK